MNFLVLSHFLFLLSIVRESLQIKCYSCVDYDKPGPPDFKSPNDPDSEYPQIPTKPCGKLGHDLLINCPAASFTCYKIARDEMKARSCGLDKASCEGLNLNGCHSCDTDGCNTATKTTVAVGTLLVSILILRIGI